MGEAGLTEQIIGGAIEAHKHWGRRRFLKAAGAGMAIWPVAGMSPAKADIKIADINIFWAADSHLRHGGEDDLSNVLRPPYMMKYASWQKLRQIRDEANAEKPAHVFHLGDACEPTQAIEDFTGIFHSIAVPHDLALGNHDLGRLPRHVNGGRSPPLSELERWHGYGHARNAGSGFNYSRRVAQRVKVIVFDANWDREGRHLAERRGSHTGRLPQGVLDWIAHELSGLGKHLVFIAGHHPPHLYAGSGKGVAATFAASDARALSAVIKRATEDNPQLQVIGMFGHYHPNGRVTDSDLDPEPDYYWRGVMKAANLGSHFPGYIIPEIVYTESEKSLYVETRIRETDKKFTVVFATRKLGYEAPR